MRGAGIALLVQGVLFWGCAYYNGLYNANRLASDAVRASREGRLAEARSLWEQAALKAESVAVRHPHSKYRDDALLLQGESLRDAGACERAVDPLAVVVDSAQEAAQRTRGALALGQCFVELDEPARARAVLTPLVSAPDPDIYRQARLWRARAALRQDDPGAALADVDSLDLPEAAFERAAALTGLGRGDDALEALAAVPGRFQEARWTAIIHRLGAASPALAARLTDQALSRADLSPGMRARLLIDDADRWEAAGMPERALERLHAAAVAAPDSAEGRLATVRTTIARLRTTADRDSLATVSGSLARAVDDGGAAGRLAEPVLALLRRVTASREASQPDFRLFLAAEALRDTLRATALAGEVFLEIARDYPGSPIAPKALLAAAHLAPARAESLGAVLASRYADSPYWLAANGAMAPGFTELEDSLRFLAGRAGPAEPVRPGRPGARPVPTDEEIPRPAAPGRGVPEP